MAENIEKKQIIWFKTDIEPIREFENKEFATLVQYADENQKHLMTLLYNEYTDELRLGCKFGNSKLNFFENAISEDEMLLTVFKLGKLYGHVECLGMIEYESMHDSIALKRFQMLIKELPNLENETQDIIKLLYKNGNTNDKELLNIVKVKSIDLKLILHTLFVNGFIQRHDTCDYYSLTDNGLRVAKQLNKK